MEQKNCCDLESVLKFACVTEQCRIGDSQRHVKVAALQPKLDLAGHRKNTAL